MIIFPAIDLMNGKVVKLESRTHHEQEKIYGSPGEVADRWLKAGAPWLHVVDLNAAFSEGMPNHLALLTLLPKIAKASAKLQWGGGVRDASTIRLLLEAELGDGGGRIERVVVGTRAVKDWAWLESAAESYPDRIVVAVDAMGRQILTAGWKEETGIDVVDFVQRAKDTPIAAFLYTNVAVEGRGTGVDWAPIEAVIAASPRPVIFSGGVSTLDDVKHLKELGAYGVVIGSALYTGKIDFAQAKALAD